MSYVTEKSRASKTGMAAAIALNGSIILAIMLSPVVGHILPKGEILKTYDVWNKEAPPPDKKIEKAAEAKQLDNPFVPDPVNDTQVKNDNNITTGKTETDGTVIALNGNGEDSHNVIKPVDPPVPIFRAAVRDPRYAKSFQPDFPVRLLQREIEGSVKVRVLVGVDGRVRNIEILSATDPDFAKATQRKALSSWRFTPATRDGVPVEDWQVLTVRFDIN
jgi:periplasmic protein TonB